MENVIEVVEKSVEKVEEVAKKVYQKLANEEKLAIREAQFILTNTREQAQAALNAAEKNLISVVEGLGRKYNLDPNKTQLNSVTLEFIDK